MDSIAQKCRLGARQGKSEPSQGLAIVTLKLTESDYSKPCGWPQTCLPWLPACTSWHFRDKRRGGHRFRTHTASPQSCSLATWSQQKKQRAPHGTFTVLLHRKQACVVGRLQNMDHQRVHCLSQSWGLHVTQGPYGSSQLCQAFAHHALCIIAYTSHTVVPAKLSLCSPPSVICLPYIP